MPIAPIAPSPGSHRHARPRLATAAIAAALPVVLAAAAGAQTQTVGPTAGTAFQERSPNQAVSVTFEYTATDGSMNPDPTTTGIGIRLHFDSSKLIFNSSVELEPEAGQENEFFLMGPSPPETDTADKDGDAATNQVMMVAWVHTDGDFPGAVPQNLITLNFTTTGGFSGITNVRVTAIDTATGFAFAGSDATIAAPGAVTPTPTNTPSGPTPTPTVTPTPGDTAILDIDGNGGAPDPLSDGIVILRWMFGFEGDNLIVDVVAPPPACSRCTANEVEAYLASISNLLDIDGNGGAPDPLSDGIVILRWMFGFEGDNLIADVVAPPPACSRCTAQEIEDYLATLTAVP